MFSPLFKTFVPPLQLVNTSCYIGGAVPPLHAFIVPLIRLFNSYISEWQMNCYDLSLLCLASCYHQKVNKLSFLDKALGKFMALVSRQRFLKSRIYTKLNKELELDKITSYSYWTHLGNIYFFLFMQEVVLKDMNKIFLSQLQRCYLLFK